MLRICSLNTEGCSRPYFFEFIKTISKSIDVLCFQEVHSAGSNVPEIIMPKEKGNREFPLYTKGFGRLQLMLANDFIGYFSPQISYALHDIEKCAHDIEYGQALFVRKSLMVHKFTSGSIYRTLGEMNCEKQGGLPSAKSMQVVTLQKSGKEVTIANVHGFWSQKGKVDMQERYIQNHGIGKLLCAHFAKSNTGKTHFLLCGDLNYHSKMLALGHLRECLEAEVGSPMVNLNSHFGIVETRTTHYKKPCREADFVFASDSILKAGLEYQVDLNVPSDHGALYMTLQT